MSARPDASSLRASVVVRTHNRARLVGRAVRALADQTLPAEAYEIVVVDDGSVDETPQVLARLACEVPNLRPVSLPDNCGVADSGNQAVKHVRSEILLFTDDDCIPARDWIERMCETLEQADIVAGAIASPSRPYLRLCHNISQSHNLLPHGHKRRVTFSATANMGFRCARFRSLGGFEAGRRMAEDMELCLRARAAGHDILFDPHAAVTHDPERSGMRVVLRHAADHAQSTISLRNTYAKLLNTPVVLSSSWLLLGSAPVIAAAVTLKAYSANPALWRYLHTAPVFFLAKLAWCLGAARGVGRRPPAPTK
ncbi:glycosyltransferase [Planctomycetota bacterium]